MGAGESKAVDAELGLFSIEERKILNDEFKELSGTNKVAEKNAMQVSSYIRALFWPIKHFLFQVKVRKSLEEGGTEIFVIRICDLMTGQINTVNSITFEGFVHSAAIMIKGLLEDKASQFMYLASGKRNSASHANFVEVGTL